MIAIRLDIHCDILVRIEQFADHFEHLSLSINIIHNKSFAMISLSEIKIFKDEFKNIVLF